MSNILILVWDPRKLFWNLSSTCILNSLWTLFFHVSGSLIHLSSIFKRVPVKTPSPISLFPVIHSWAAKCHPFTCPFPHSISLSKVTGPSFSACLSVWQGNKGQWVWLWWNQMAKPNGTLSSCLFLQKGKHWDGAGSPMRQFGKKSKQDQNLEKIKVDKCPSFHQTFLLSLLLNPITLTKMNVLSYDRLFSLIKDFQASCRWCTL